MKLNGNITILVNKEGVRFEIHDADSRIQILKFTMNPEDFCSALSRLARIPCELEVNNNLDRLGKKLEVRQIEFILPNHSKFAISHKEIASTVAKTHCPDGWEVFDNFDSQDSFFVVDDKLWAKASIRRWVEK